MPLCALCFTDEGCPAPQLALRPTPELTEGSGGDRSSAEGRLRLAIRLGALRFLNTSDNFLYIVRILKPGHMSTCTSSSGDIQYLRSTYSWDKTRGFSGSVAGGSVTMPNERSGREVEGELLTLNDVCTLPVLPPMAGLLGLTSPRGSLNSRCIWCTTPAIHNITT